MTTLNKLMNFLIHSPLLWLEHRAIPKKFGYTAFKELKEKGMKIIPVNHRLLK